MSVSVWPLPINMTYAAGMQPLDIAAFQLTIVNVPPPGNASSEAFAIMQAAFQRYYDIIFGNAPAPVPAPGGVTSLSVQYLSPSDDLQLGTSEAYSLALDGSPTGQLVCETVYGCLRGLETFSQLVVRPASGGMAITGVPLRISDAPRFPHRGLLIDSSRHFLPISMIKSIIDALSYDKANVLHWHITDVQSFPIQSQAVPALVDGAWAPAAVYTLDDLRDVVAYGKYRGIAVVPEIDSPAHVESWGVGIPEILINCSSNPYLSLLDPSKNATFDVYAQLVSELAGIFPDNRFHMGVDEVTFDCLNTTAINAWMPSVGIAAGDYAGVVRYYMERAQSIVMQANVSKTPMYWQEAFDHYGPGNNNPTPPPALLSPESIIYLWYCPCWNWANMGNVTAYGLRGVKTDDWYLDNLGTTWTDVYVPDPLTDATCNFTAGWANCTCPQPNGCYYNITDPIQISRVLGGEVWTMRPAPRDCKGLQDFAGVLFIRMQACAWGEHMDATMMQGRIWPRMSAIAERLWTRREVNDPNAATQRITDHRCRLVARGIAVEPIQPDYCDGSRQ